MANTDKFFNLIKQLVSKDLTEDGETPSDFSMDNPASTTDTNVNATTDNPADTTDTNTADTSGGDDLDLSGLSSGFSGGPSGNVDVNVNSEDGQQNQNSLNSAAPIYKVLDVIFDDDDDLNTKVKIQDIKTGKIEIKDLKDIII